MNLLKPILYAGAAYLYITSGGSKSIQKEVENLKKSLDEANVRAAIAEDELEKEKTKAYGDLKDRLKCFLNVTASRVHNSGNTFNTKFILTVKNVGTIPINIAAVRVFWNAGGYQSTWSPWSKDAIILQPNKTVEVTLKGTYLKRVFSSIQAVQAVESYFTSRKGQLYDQTLPLKCEAEFIVTSNDEKKTLVLKDFSGTMTAYHFGYIYYPYSTTNGTDISAFDENKQEQ